MKSKYVARGALTVGMFAAGPILYAATTVASTTTRLAADKWNWPATPARSSLTFTYTVTNTTSQVSFQTGTAANGHRQLVMNLDEQGTCVSGFIEAIGTGLTSSGTPIAACSSTDSTADGVSVGTEPTGICDSARQLSMGIYCVNPCSRSSCLYTGDQCLCTP